jgi:hypothetical protein
MSAAITYDHGSENPMACVICHRVFDKRSQWVWSLNRFWITGSPDFWFAGDTDRVCRDAKACERRRENTDARTP